MKKQFTIERIAIIFLIFGSCILILLPLLRPFRGHWPIDSVKASDFGQFVGGYIGSFFMLISVVILIISLDSQRKSSQLQQFETKFLDLLKLHRENVAEQRLANKSQRTVFVILRAEFQDLFEIVKKIANHKFQNKLDYAQIAYVILYFGIGKTSTPMVKSLLNVYDKKIINKIISEADTFRVRYGYKKLEYLGKFSLGDYFPFNGHQSRLGHYYRHLFQTIKYIDNNPYLKLEEQKFYAKTLRAQLSNHELAIFFYNSLSPLGNIWWEPITTDQNKNKISYLKKYEFIKNLPLKGFTYELNPKKLLDIEFEWDSIAATPYKKTKSVIRN
jgi:hypothetical protein